ncbi:hypothetical protein K470DRAFT_25436 [Piedraia hortae CBS 480.64]|uniref:Uncharacterized protein n=1 Tax=Piedraia hortae CBS 480.64 TaxID=1314780 RepID=A0A6A7C365_9PEZI|nr:hypothetical protein K470DRAFT_25436 [Piedraia hortae CBS 480.64]
MEFFDSAGAFFIYCSEPGSLKAFRTVSAPKSRPLLIYSIMRPIRVETHIGFKAVVCLGAASCDIGTTLAVVRLEHFSSPSRTKVSLNTTSDCFLAGPCTVEPLLIWRSTTFCGCRGTSWTPLVIKRIACRFGEYRWTVSVIAPLLSCGNQGNLWCVPSCPMIKTTFRPNTEWWKGPKQGIQNPNVGGAAA